MAIVFTCPRCDRNYSVADSMAGRRVTCKACGQDFGVPAASASASANSSWDDDDGFAMAPPPSYQKPPASFDDELPPPRRVRPKAAREVVRSYRGEDDSALSPFVKAFLVIVGGLMIVPPLGMAGYAASNGDSANAILMLWLAIVFALFGMMIVYSLKILAVAVAEKGLFFGIFCMIVPLASLIFIVTRWERTKSLVAGYMIGWIGLVVASVLVSGSLPAGPGQNAAGGGLARLNGGGGGGGGGLVEVQHNQPMWRIGEGVIVDVANLDDETSRELFGEKLVLLAKQKAPRGGVSTGTAGIPPAGMTRYQVEPVDDPNVFAQSLSDFAKVGKVNDRKIEAVANLQPDEIASRREFLANRKKVEAVRQKESDEQHALAMQNHKKSMVEAESCRKDEEIANTPPPLMTKVDPNAGPIDKALADTRTPDGFKARDALKRLAWGIPEDRKAEVVKAVAPMLEVKDFFTASEAAKTLGALKSPEAVPALIAVLDRSDLASEAVTALGEIGDVRAASEIADRIEKIWPDANKALIAIGPAAESAVLAKLKDRESRVRTLALEVLAEIGGNETLKTMKTMRPDPDFGVKVRAGQTMEAIAARMKAR